MKKLLLALTLTMMTAGAWAVPAKRGMWKTITLSDGTEVRAQLTGDEHVHFWQTEAGQCYVEQADGVFDVADLDQLRSRAASRRATLSARKRAPKRVVTGDQTHYTGQKKGIVILMQFTDTSFKTANNNAKYNDILNKENYTTSPFKGSVADYFKAQSGGVFELNFDVVGPYTAKNKASYYGANNSEGSDMRPEELIVEAVKAANAEVNFKDYDWDGDGEVDQVFVLYAGKGEADGGAKSTIWPHMWYLSETNSSLSLDGVLIDTYACSNEIMPSGEIEGIGCFCHEFSHCLGFPDFYDTSYSGWYGTGDYDLMCGGSYNGGTFKPAGYTAYEKWMAGWIEPIVLDKEGVTVENMKPLSDGGEAYIIYNDGNRNEYYLVENRQKTGWDASLPGKGLMITHVDFDSQIWQDNTPNTKVTSSDVALYGYSKTNNHQRCAIIRADNSSSQYNTGNELYPYGTKNSLTDSSTPKASLFNANTDGSKLMHKPITEIKQNSDMTMSFKFSGGSGSPGPVDPVDPVDSIIVAHGDTLFYESFDKCDGTGANDGIWDSRIAGQSAKYKPDYSGWVVTGNAAYGGYQCARFGNVSTVGMATTPSFTIDGTAKLTFKASAWNTDGPTLSLSVNNSDVTISPATVSMKSFEWTEYSVTLKGTGVVKLTFLPTKRFLLDEVLVKKKNTSVGIDSVQRQQDSQRVYTLDGRFAGTSLDMLRPGIYVINGRKVVK